MTVENMIVENLAIENLSVESLAEFAGQHALWILAIGCVVLLLLMVFVWRVIESYGETIWRVIAAAARIIARKIDSTLLNGYLKKIAPAEYLVLHLLTGFAVVFIALTIFFESTEALDVDEELARFDYALAAGLRVSLAPETYTFFAYVTHLGDVLVLAAISLAIAALLAWRRRWLQLTGWLTAIIGNALLTRALKALFQRLRPLHDHGFAVAEGWSFPSGHASSAMVVYGMLAYLSIRTVNSAAYLPLALAASAVILIVGGSRIFLQVHFFSDVIAGFCLGAAWLAVCIAGTEIALRHRAQNNNYQ
jgi:membrane-associated phospholipid phosphatase